MCWVAPPIAGPDDAKRADLLDQWKELLHLQKLRFDGTSQDPTFHYPDRDLRQEWYDYLFVTEVVRRSSQQLRSSGQQTPNLPVEETNQQVEYDRVRGNHGIIEEIHGARQGDGR